MLVYSFWGRSRPTIQTVAVLKILCRLLLFVFHGMLCSDMEDEIPPYQELRTHRQTTNFIHSFIHIRLKIVLLSERN